MTVLVESTTTAGYWPAAQPIAMHAAASRMLDHLYPDETRGRLEALGHSAAAAVLTATPKIALHDHAWQIGYAAAERLIRRAPWSAVRTRIARSIDWMRLSVNSRSSANANAINILGYSRAPDLWRSVQRANERIGGDEADAGRREQSCIAGAVEDRGSRWAEAILQALGVDDQLGLDEAQTTTLRAKYGWNRLAEAPPVAVRVGPCLERAAHLALARVERRIDVDDVHGTIGRGLQNRQIIPQDKSIRLVLATTGETGTSLEYVDSTSGARTPWHPDVSPGNLTGISGLTFAPDTVLWVTDNYEYVGPLNVPDWSGRIIRWLNRPDNPV